MQFTVGNYTYTIVVADRVYLDGTEVTAKCDWTNRTIALSASLDRQQRRVSLRHECWHAYEFVVGRAVTSEDQADRHAEVSDAIDEQIGDQGGWDALDALFDEHLAASRLRPVADPPPVADGFAYPLPGRQPPRCPRCSRQPAAGSARSSQPEWDFDRASMVLSREYDCDRCGVVVRWRELADNLGYPRGIVLDDAPDVLEAVK